jgi:hypothetical protein
MQTLAMPSSTTTLAATAPKRARESYAELLERLSELSVAKYHDPYTDIDWDAPEHTIEPADPRHALAPEHPLTRSAWYAALDESTRARFGLAWTAQSLKNGIHLEACLSRGLLDVCPSWPNGSLEYRYAMHEVIEEGRHSLMFQEFIARTGVFTRSPTALERWVDDRVIGQARRLPELFFFAVLAGELFIDVQNRCELRRPKHAVHPLLRRVIQIHVTEEARHMCFAERFLHEHLPAVSPAQRERMAWLIPVLCAESARKMLVPDAHLVRNFGIPQSVMREVFGRHTEYRQQLTAAVAPIARLCEQYGMLQPRHVRWWHALGLAD